LADLSEQVRKRLQAPSESTPLFYLAGVEAVDVNTLLADKPPVATISTLKGKPEPAETKAFTGSRNDAKRNDAIIKCALREFEEESGITLTADILKDASRSLLIKPNPGAYYFAVRIDGLKVDTSTFPVRVTAPSSDTTSTPSS